MDPQRRDLHRRCTLSRSDYANATLPELIRQARSSETSNADLTFIAEKIGEHEMTQDTEVLLCCLAANSSPLVREGAVYGLAPHRGRPGVRFALEHIAATDSSPAVRECAMEALS